MLGSSRHHLFKRMSPFDILLLYIIVASGGFRGIQNYQK